MSDRDKDSVAGPKLKGLSRFSSALSLMGPAFIAGAWQFGPGNITSAAQAGGQFGYDLIWVIAASVALMMMFTDMSVRIALMSPDSLIETIKRTLGRPWGVCAGLGVFAITLMFSVGNAAGTGAGFSMLFGGPPVISTIVCTIVVALLVQSRNYYKIFERLVLVFIVSMGIGFVATALLANPDWKLAAGGFLPSLPPGVGDLLIALVATNLSVNAAFYTGYATRERGLTREQYREITLSDTIPGIIAPGVMTILLVVASAAVLHGSGREVKTVPELAGVLQPLFGEVGSTVFALGFAGTAFSAMIANATAGGSLLADALSWGNSLNSRRVKSLITVVLVFGAFVTATARKPPEELIIIANALTVVVAPLLAILMIVLANHRALMGDLRNRWWQNVIAAIGLTAILATCYQLVMILFFRN